MITFYIKPNNTKHMSLVLNLVHTKAGQLNRHKIHANTITWGSQRLNWECRLASLIEVILMFLRHINGAILFMMRLTLLFKLPFYVQRTHTQCPLCGITKGSDWRMKRKKWKQRQKWNGFFIPFKYKSTLIMNIGDIRFWTVMTFCYCCMLVVSSLVTFH